MQKIVGLEEIMETAIDTQDETLAVKESADKPPVSSVFVCGYLFGIVIILLLLSRKLGFHE